MVSLADVFHVHVQRSLSLKPHPGSGDQWKLQRQKMIKKTLNFSFIVTLWWAFCDGIFFQRAIVLQKIPVS